MNIAYRDATATDAALLGDLFRRAFVETFGHLYRSNDLEAFLARASDAAFRDELSDGDHRVRFAEADGVAVGFVKLGPLTLPVRSQRPAVELDQLYLLKPWHGLGIAQALMDWALGQARRSGAEELYLSVWTDNRRAQAFYRRYGFTYVGPYAFMVGEQADEDEIWKLELS